MVDHRVKVFGAARPCVRKIDVSFRSFPSLCTSDARAVVGTATMTRDGFATPVQFLLLVGKGAGYYLTPQGTFLPSSMPALAFGHRGTLPLGLNF